MSENTNTADLARQNHSSEVMIACDTLRTEIEHVMHAHGIERRVIWMEHLLQTIPQ